MPKTHWYCTCGAHWMIDTTDPVFAERSKGSWEQFHTGEAHAPCDAKMARNARAKQDRELEAEFAKEARSDV